MHMFITAYHGVVDKKQAPGARGHAFGSRISFFLFFNQKIFHYIIKNFRVPTVARPISSPYSGLIGEFYMAWRKNFTKIFTYRGVQTVSKSFMSKLVNAILNKFQEAIEAKEFFEEENKKILHNKYLLERRYLAQIKAQGQFIQSLQEWLKNLFSINFSRYF